MALYPASLFEPQAATEQDGVHSDFALSNRATIYPGNCLDLLSQIPSDSVQLVMTSPPYNIGKSYEKKTGLDAYIEQQAGVIAECARVLAYGGSFCWQVGNYIEKSAGTASEVFPLDILFYPIIRKTGLKLRNRIVWRIEHGLHAKTRLSGRHETVLWFTKGDDYYFNLDPIRIPQKYPGKKGFRGANAGEYSGNPLGKNPGDVWEIKDEYEANLSPMSDVWNIPNVKSMHPEKTEHPAQYPIELVERFVLSVTRPGDLVVDPYMGSGSTGCAALLHGRRTAGADLLPEYVAIAKQRMLAAMQGNLPKRELGKPIHVPKPGSKLTFRDDAPQIDREGMLLK
jgi:adenine-specific DNA-methyltransferase